MKFKSLIVALFATVACTNAWAWDLSSLKNINLGSVVNSLVSTDKVEISDLKGTWKSVAPAIVFTSENSLQKAASGTVTKGTKDGTIVFNFSTLGSTKLRQVTAYVQKGTQLSITFDISKLNTLLSSVSKFTGNSTVSTVSSLLNSYKGMYAGFKFEKQ